MEQPMRTVLASIVVIVLASGSAPAGVEFRKQIIDREFRAEACGAIDVNRDGRLDIVAGENWYEAPAWTPHKFRDVPLEGGYRDIRVDYPFDVNGDGWTDLITVHRGPTIEWLENPRVVDQPWPAHAIGESANTESVIIADLNGDGVPEVVGPAGKDVEALAWWHAVEEL